MEKNFSIQFARSVSMNLTESNLILNMQIKLNIFLPVYGEMRDVVV